MTRRAVMAVGVVVGAIIVLNLLAQGLDRAVGGNEPTGSPGSSYATASPGLAAYASLLAHFDHSVRQLRGPLAHARLDPSETVVVVEPSVLTTDDASTLLTFVTGGGRLVIGGNQPFYLRDFRDVPPQWEPFGPITWSGVDAQLGGSTSVESAGNGSFDDAGSGRALVREEGRALVTIDHAGLGDIVFVADPSFMENDHLAVADNAAVALALAGAGQRSVAFAEGVHGFGNARGLGALPGRWKLALALVAIAAIVFVASRARRFGPPDRPARELPPARAEYVQAMAVSLERTRDPARALEPVRRWARRRLVARTASPGSDEEADVARGARVLGITDDELAPLQTPPREPEDVVALGRLVAHIVEQEGRYR